MKRARVSASWTLASLPREALNSIVDQLLDDRSVAAFAVVSSEWAAVVNEQRSRRRLESFVIPKCPRSRRDMLSLRYELTLRGPYVRFLKIQEMPFFWQEWESQWTAILSHLPRLKELKVVDDDLLNPSSDELSALVRALGTQCPILEALVFPHGISHPWREDVKGSSRDDGFALADDVWKIRGNLKRLQLNMGYSLNDVTSANKYLNALISRFPAVQALTNSTAKFCEPRLILFYEVWIVDLATWTRFCKTCTELTEFDFVYVPFATVFFEIFGQIVKPQLTNLELGLSTCCDWPHYLRELSSEDRAIIESTGYALSAVSVQSALHACPNLRCLKIEWGGVSHDLLDTAVFGDAFMEELAILCPQLSELTCSRSEMDYFANSSRWSLEAFTDRSMAALSRLRHLERVVLRHVNISGKGLFQLAILHAEPSSYSREYNIRSSRPGLEVVEEFLSLLVVYDGQLPRSVSLSAFGSFTGDYTEKDLLRLSQLISQARTKFHGIELRCLAASSGASMSLLEFQFASSSSLIRDWEEVRDRPGVTDCVLFDSITKRKYDFYHCPGTYDYGPYAFHRADVFRPSRRFEPIRFPNSDDDL